MSDPIGDDGGAGGDDQYQADAFEGDSGLTGAATYTNFDAPPSLPGFDVNTGVPGTTVKPFDDPVPGAQLNADVFQTEMDPQHLAGLTAANDNLAPGMMTNAAAAIGAAGSAQGPTQGPAPLGPQGQATQQQGQQPPPGVPPPATPPPAVVSGSGGFLTAQVQHADNNLISMLQGAASGAGGVTARFAPTVTLTAGGVQAGGSVQGDHDSLGPYTIYKDIGWFGPTIDAWQQQPPPPAAGAPGGDPGAGGDGIGDDPATMNKGINGILNAGGTMGGDAGFGGGPPVGQQAIDAAVDKSLAGWGSGPRTDPGDDLIPESAYPTAEQADTGTGFNDSVWSGIDGFQTVGQAEAIPEGFNDEGKPLGSIAAFGDNTPDAGNTPQQWAAIRGAEPFGGEFSGARNINDHSNDPALFDDSDPVMSAASWF